jgi:hypothetical protein
MGSENKLSPAEKNLQRLRLPLIGYGLIGGAVLAYQPGKFVW